MMNEKVEPIVASRDEYLAHVRAQKISGISIVKYCKLHGLNLNKFYHYKSYRPAKAAHKFTKVKIESSRRDLNLAHQQPEMKSVVKPEKPIDPAWLAKLIFELNNLR